MFSEGLRRMEPIKKTTIPYGRGEATVTTWTLPPEMRNYYGTTRTHMIETIGVPGENAGREFANNDWRDAHQHEVRRVAKLASLSPGDLARLMSEPGA